MRKSSGFTLIELLVVISIISVLAGLLMVGINAAQRSAQITVTRTLIQSLEGALATYHEANSSYPDIALPTDPGRDNPRALYRALCNLPEFEGSLTGAPLFTPKDDQAGLLVDTNNSSDEETTTEDANEQDFGDGTATGDAPHDDLVLRDSWGNFIHYMEWESRTQNKNGQDYWGNDVEARRAVRESFGLWSDGPDQINNIGDEDDINNWN